MSDSGQMEQQLQEASTARRDLEDSSKVIRGLEKQLKGVTQEKNDLHKVPISWYLKKNEAQDHTVI